MFSGSVSRLPLTSEGSCQPHPHLNLLNNYFGSSFSFPIFFPFDVDPLKMSSEFVTILLLLYLSFF